VVLSALHINKHITQKNGLLAHPITHHCAVGSANDLCHARDMHRLLLQFLG
jgi:hypothetical protein